jgi:hypothetical protein
MRIFGIGRRGQGTVICEGRGEVAIYRVESEICDENRGQSGRICC